jgi:hypothetical protein
MRNARGMIPAPVAPGLAAKGLSPRVAVAVLVAVTVLVGVAGYVVLGAVMHQGTQSVTTCSPAGSHCEGNTTASDGLAIADSPAVLNSPTIAA